MKQSCGATCDVSIFAKEFSCKLTVVSLAFCCFIVLCFKLNCYIYSYLFTAMWENTSCAELIPHISTHVKQATLRQNCHTQQEYAICVLDVHACSTAGLLWFHLPKSQLDKLLFSLSSTPRKEAAYIIF